MIRISTTSTRPTAIPSILWCAGHKSWAGTIQFRGTLITTRDVDYRVNQFSRLPEVNMFALRQRQKLGVEWHFGHSAVALEKDGDRIAGCIAKAGDGYVRFSSQKAVVLTPGNFQDIGYKLGVWAGGHMANTPIVPVEGRAPSDASRAFGMSSFLILNRRGERFTDESAPYNIGPGISQQPAGFVTSVTDNKWLQQIRLSGVQHGNPDFGRPEYIEQ